MKRIFNFFLSSMLIVGMLMVLASLLVCTHVGTRLSLSAISNVTGLQLSGVSGSWSRALHIQHLEWHSENWEWVADDVELQWQPKALLERHLILDYVKINNLRMAKAQGDDEPLRLPDTLQLPLFIRLVKADDLLIRQFNFSTLGEKEKAGQAHLFTALHAQVFINAAQYFVRLSGVTPWGSGSFNGTVESAAPFKSLGFFDWTGLAIKQNGITLPALQLQGDVTGYLQTLQVQAQLKMGGEKTNSIIYSSKSPNQHAKAASGQFAAVFTPFNRLPLHHLDLDLHSINPKSFYADAPYASLALKAKVDLKENGITPLLQGTISVHNATPASWNYGGIPIATLRSEFTLNKQQLTWQASKIELQGGGSATGSGQLILPDSATMANKKSVAALPLIRSMMVLDKVNLLHLDSRLSNTQLNGKIEAQTNKTGLQFGVHLLDNQPHYQATLEADLDVNQQRIVQIKQIRLQAKDAILTAQGRFALKGLQEFTLEADAHHFNPARWLTVPTGDLSSHVSLTGQLQQGWNVSAEVDNLNGQFAGMPLKGEASFKVQQDNLLLIKKLELSWGKNVVTAKGSWRNHAPEKEHLQFKLAVPELYEVSHPFEKIVPIVLKGSLYADGVLDGTSGQLSGHVAIQANNFLLSDVVSFDHLHANMVLADGAKGQLQGQIEVTQLFAGTSDIKQQSKQKTSAQPDGFKIERLEANLAGLRHAHQLSVLATLPKKYQLILQAHGDLKKEMTLDSKLNDMMQWQGQIQQLDISGPSDLHLISPFAMQFSTHSMQMGDANWEGTLGQLQLHQLSWSPSHLKTMGAWSAIPVPTIIKLWQPTSPLIGNLQMDAKWQFNVGEQINGQLEIKRTSGDAIIQEVAGGHSQIFALGLHNVSFTAGMGEDGKSSLQSKMLHQLVHLKMEASGSQLGQVEATIHSSLDRTEKGWQFATSAPIGGAASLKMNDMQWMSQFLGSGVVLRGGLQLQSQLAGTVKNPDYTVTLRSQELEVSLTELGIILPHGVLEASIKANSEVSQLQLDKLTFSQTIQAPPKHEKLTGLPWLNETGYVTASGMINLRNGQGAISTQWQRFPFLQTHDNWMVASGEAQLKKSEKEWNLTGQLLADAAYFSVPERTVPILSSDVVVVEKNNNTKQNKAEKLHSSLDFTINMGKKFVFVGREFNTSLRGDLRLRSRDDGPLQATGSIQTVDGTYEGYGQKLAIERGIVNFQGPLNNPGLNVRAMRQGLPMDVGVEVLGTVAKPEVRLISVPNMPDQDKLAWLVLGHSSDQVGGSEVSLLLSAAGALFGGENKGNIQRDVAQKLGLDDISVNTSTGSPDSQLPVQTVAGNISSNATNNQVFSVGKRITPNLTFSIERSLTEATDSFKLIWKLTRRFSLIGRAGSDNSLDAQYLFSFN